MGFLRQAQDDKPIPIDIKITFVGLRPGEKLYEELLSNNTTTIPTHHEKIMISKDPYMSFNDIDLLIIQIIKAAVKRNKLEVVQILKNIVPEFISNNSEFELLDHQKDESVI